MEKKQQIINSINVLFNEVNLSLSLIAGVSTLFIPIVDWSLSVKIISVCIILIQGASILLSNKDQELTEQLVFQMSKKQVFKMTNPCLKPMSLQKARDELRFGLHILLFAVTIVCLCLCIRFRSVWLFIASMAIIVLAYMYADYIPNAVLYAQLYDKRFIKEDEKENAMRGLARIYLEEYKITKFNRNHDFYKEISEYELEKTDEQDRCIKNILYMCMDNIRCPEIVYSIVLLSINIAVTIPKLLDGIIGEFLGNKVTIIVCIIVNIILATINIIDGRKYMNTCKKIKELSDSINDNKRKCREHRFDKYKQYKDKLFKEKRIKQFEMVRARGIYVYCSEKISEGKTLDTVPLRYKMLFIHKLYTNRYRFIYTVILLMIFQATLLLEFDVPLQIVLLMLLPDLILAQLFERLFLPEIGRKEIANECEKLMGAKP